MEAIMFIILQIFFATRAVLKIGEYINNSRHLARKYARIFVREHYLFREKNNFPRVKLGDCELRGTDNIQQQIYMGLLTKCEVKMAGYWPISFFACLWTKTKSRSINSQKRTTLISSHFHPTNLVNKGFIIWLSGKLFLQETAGNPERARWLHLASSGGQ